MRRETIDLKTPEQVLDVARLCVGIWEKAGVPRAAALLRATLMWLPDYQRLWRAKRLKGAEVTEKGFANLLAFEVADKGLTFARPPLSVRGQGRAQQRGSYKYNLPNPTVLRVLIAVLDAPAAGSLELLYRQVAPQLQLAEGTIRSVAIYYTTWEELCWLRMTHMARWHSEDPLLFQRVMWPLWLRCSEGRSFNAIHVQIENMVGIPHRNIHECFSWYATVEQLRAVWARFPDVLKNARHAEEARGLLT